MTKVARDESGRFNGVAVDIMERFMQHVAIQENGCWLWTGATAGKPGMEYGDFTIPADDGKRHHVAAHKFLYEKKVGPIPARHQLHHECTIKLCVNYGHLKPLTVKEHHRVEPRNPPHELCVNGHPLSLGYLRKGGGRKCRTCRNERERARRRMRNTTRVSLFCDGEKIITDDHTHGPHNESNPDDGVLSPFAVAFAEALKKLGFETSVRALD